MRVPQDVIEQARAFARSQGRLGAGGRGVYEQVIPSQRESEVPDAIHRILDATESAFRRTGYAATSLRGIALEAGVSKSLVLYHFQTKEQLFVIWKEGSHTFEHFGDGDMKRWFDVAHEKLRTVNGPPTLQFC